MFMRKMVFSKILLILTLSHFCTHNMQIFTDIYSEITGIHIYGNFVAYKNRHTEQVETSSL